MMTAHKIYFENAQGMSALAPESIDLVVTSPPYPMIEMWDQSFCSANPKISQALQKQKGQEAFELMHGQLDRVWSEVFRVLKTGGFACINIGDATRRLGDNFQLYPNHMRILAQMIDLGLSPLPLILWRKQTNAPNKFMGSGTLPAGAYVTLEHEYVLIFRKGGKREFRRLDQKKLRRESSMFWEERNLWYSDVWMDLKGVRQDLPGGKGHRARSAAFPLELPYRLIQMYSVKGDLVLDPFLGMGTTMIAAIITGRNCVGYELDASFKDPIDASISGAADLGRQQLASRLQQHAEFAAERSRQKGPLKYTNIHYRFPVVSRQEVELFFNEIVSVEKLEAQSFQATYRDPSSTTAPEKSVQPLKKDAPFRQPAHKPLPLKQLTLLD